MSYHDSIKQKPTTFDFEYTTPNGSKEKQMVHESIFRSYAVLERIVQMLRRGDSRETILEEWASLTLRDANEVRTDSPMI